MDINQPIVVTVARSVIWSVGTKIWYVVKADTGEHYQRWSYTMDATDEVLMLAQTGDIISLVTEEGFHGNDAVTKIVSAQFYSAVTQSQQSTVLSPLDTRSVDHAISLLMNVYNSAEPSN